MKPLLTALLVALGGALGALLRWQAGRLLPWNAQSLPWATLVVNLLGAFAAGLFFVVLARAEPVWRSFLLVGLCGALTTFSALMLEVLMLLEQDRASLALLYLGLSFGFGLLLCLLGYAIGYRLTGEPQ